MAERTARATADNNVQDVISAIDNYTCGPIRALAQDPPQNSMDARRDGQTVHVAYQVLLRRNENGDQLRIMTIADRGTTGLDGPILTADDLAEREQDQGQLVIQSGENWAAWEAMRYTKSGEDSLGSRGQGKYAYLYHSLHHPPGASTGLPKHAGRVVILYDTLLPNGEYRLGVRYHNPSSKVVEPPFLGDEARRIIATSYDDDHFSIPLNLKPLSEPGTRVIIPFLSKEAVEAVESGELAHWLQVEWWRPIQKEELEITVTGSDGLTRTIGVPDFWQSQPWNTHNTRSRTHEQIKLPSHNQDDPRIIKRVVLFHDSGLASEDIEGPAQINGVQLLRGGQWIVTLEMSEFSDWIPKEHRGGFRGFVEFDRRLDRALREIENPAHDGYNRRKGIYQEIVQEIRNAVKEFAIQRGWHDSEDVAPDPRFDTLVQEFARLFVAPESGRHTPSPAEWRCQVNAAYPDPAIAHANWGDAIRLDSTCYRRPSADGEPITFEAALIRPDGSEASAFARRSQNMRSRSDEESTAGVNFGELQVNHPGRPDSPFTESGRYSIKVTCTNRGEAVTTGKCSFYVACDPPEPAINPVTIQLRAFNPEDGSKVIPQDGELRWEATIRNRGQTSVEGVLAIALDEHLLLRDAAELDRIAVGDQPQILTRDGSARIHQGAPRDGALPLDWDSSVRSQQTGPEHLTEIVLPLADGRYAVQASLEQTGETLATARALIWVGTPPDEDQAGDIPFVVTQVEEPLAPRWRLEHPGQPGDPHTLLWSAANPVYNVVRNARRPSRGMSRPPQEEYLGEIIAEALIDWAVQELRHSADEGRIRLVSARILASSPELGEQFEDRVERLIAKEAENDPLGYGQAQRDMAALMVEVARLTRGR
ncbi:hypothetical protein [Candidatus Poriferisocius sp.]|uniref:hypothetical protein n=1 Tax=Candidatus Poriferisocius sp. TaxID=3101276 RepID=UPI003B01933D